MSKPFCKLATIACQIVLASCTDIDYNGNEPSRPKKNVKFYIFQFLI